MRNLVTFFLAAALALNVAYAGNEGGNGTDGHTMLDATAWFLGAKKEIKACYIIADGFGVPASTIEIEIKAAYKVWSDYMVAKRVAWEQGGELFATVVILSGGCVGDEDLKFYFGAEDEGVTREKNRHIRPFGFAERVSYDVKKGWSKGYVWIAMPGSVASWNGAPNWTLPNALRGILIHEIGHTFGNSHVSGTVMDGDFGNYLGAQSANGYYDFELSHVDHDRELVPCRKCGIEFIGKNNSPVLPEQYPQLVESFKRLVGRDPVGRISASFTKEAETKALSGVLIYADDKAAVRFAVDAHIQANTISAQPVFHAIVGQIGAGIGLYSAHKMSRHTGNGIDLPVMVNRNGEGRLEIRTLEDTCVAYPTVFESIRVTRE